MIHRQHPLPRLSWVRCGVGAWLAAAGLTLLPAVVSAQGAGGAPLPPQSQSPAIGTARSSDPRAAKNPKDSAGKGGKADNKGPLVDWGVADSVTLDLLKRKGYN
ncbi:hypothetical protein EBR44_07795, partial [bacterium]|nr:hypothetical protein [bacterium]